LQNKPSFPQALERAFALSSGSGSVQSTLASEFEKKLRSFSVEELRDERARHESLSDKHTQMAQAIASLIQVRELFDSFATDVVREVRNERNASTLVDMASRLSKPALTKAILTVVATQPEASWPADQILSELNERGWAPGGRTPRNSLDATLSTLTKRGQLERVDRATYRLTADATASTFKL
jgi:hypothetical protein